MQLTQTLVVTADRATAESLAALLADVAVPHHTSIKRNLDGETATWIVVATLGGQILPHLLTFLQTTIGGRRVKRIKWGDLEIENPSKEDLERFRALIDRSIEPLGTSDQDKSQGA
ncbi:MAG: hypothetical protein M3256_11115 [Actinomycetota bacterium]|nr:hypothetical protein [Actinomycetota bacterium]